MIMTKMQWPDGRPISEESVQLKEQRPLDDKICDWDKNNINQRIDDKDCVSDLIFMTMMDISI